MRIGMSPVNDFSVEMRLWDGKGFSRSGLGCDVVFVGGDEGALVVEDLPAGGENLPNRFQPLESAGRPIQRRVRCRGRGSALGWVTIVWRDGICPL